MSDSKAEVKLKPPFGAVSWFADFFKLMERIKIDKVDKALLTANNIVPSSNVSSVINGLKFLDLINEDGSTTERMKSLSVVGAEYQKNFEKMVRDAYALMFNKVKNVEQALADDVVNCFRGDYGMAPSTAKQGVQIFVFLAQKAGITLSQSIVEDLAVSQERKRTKREGARPPKPRRERDIIKDAEEEGKYVVIPEGMHKIEYNDAFLMFLRKGDKKTRERIARLVRQFIDVYVQEEETG